MLNVTPDKMGRTSLGLPILLLILEYAAAELLINVQNQVSRGISQSWTTECVLWVNSVCRIAGCVKWSATNGQQSEMGAIPHPLTEQAHLMMGITCDECFYILEK